MLSMSLLDASTLTSAGDAAAREPMPDEGGFIVNVCGRKG